MNHSWWKVMGLAMGLPSLILGAFFGIYTLVENGILGWPIGLIILLLVIVNTLFWMVRLGLVGKNRQ